jgi:hypothetical protein
MVLILPSKGTIWQTGYKRKIQQSVAYRRPISLTETSTGLGGKARRRFTTSVAPENRQEKQYLSWKIRLLTYIDQMREKRTCLTNKRGNTPKGNDNYQHICTQHQCTQFHQTYSERPKNIYKLQHSGSKRL